MAFKKVYAPDKFRKMFDTVLNDEFMQKYTKFKNLADFKAGSAVYLNWNTFLWVYNEELMDGYCQESTKFKSFEEMIMTAFDEAFPDVKVDYNECKQELADLAKKVEEDDAKAKKEKEENEKAINDEAGSTPGAKKE